MKSLSEYMGSLCNFDTKGIYVCLCKDTKDYRIVSHEVIYKLASNKTFKINEPMHSEGEGYDVRFGGIYGGKTYKSECFIKGIDIEKIKK